MLYDFTRIKRIIIAALLALCFALPLHAQEQTPPPPPHKHDPEAIKARILERVLEVKHQKLRETLLMDDEQSKKFFAVYEPAEKEMIDLVKQKQEQEIKLLQLTQGNYKDADVDPTLEKIKGLTHEIENRYEQLNTNLKPILNPRQRAKLLVFEHEFNRIAKEKVRNRIEEWKDNHPGRRPFKPKTSPPPPQHPGKG